MIVYNHKIFKDYDLYKEEKSSDKILLKEDKSLTSFNNLQHSLKLINNQSRKVSFFSNSSFSNLQQGQIIEFLVFDVLIFYWKINENIISYNFLGNKDEKLLEYWFLHTVLPLYFTFENKYYFLHAGCVQIDDKAVLFVANSYGGKSTLTNHFICKNEIMVSDDKVGVFSENGKFYVIPSYPYHRPYRNQEDLGKEVKQFANSKKEIRTIYNLIKVEKDDKVEISKVLGIEKFKVLRNTTDVDITSIYKKQRFDTLANIANEDYIYDLTIPWDLTRLDEVYKKVKEHQNYLKG